MAAGEGRRLRPLTERWPKPMLPIDGRPVIVSVLRELAAAGAGVVYVVTGHLAEKLERLLGDGSAFRLELRYVHQPRAEGSADTVTRALAAGARLPLVCSGADNVFAPGDLGRFARVFDASGAAAAIGARPGGDPAPLWGLGPAVRPLLDGLSGPPFELLEAVRRAEAAGERLEWIEIGHTRDLTDALDLVNQNFPYLRAYE